MSYLSEMLGRTDPRYIACFLASGGSPLSPDDRAWEARLDAAQEKFHVLAGAHMEESQEDELFGYVADCNSLYLELGLRVGAVLAARLLAPY